MSRSLDRLRSVPAVVPAAPAGDSPTSAPGHVVQGDPDHGLGTLLPHETAGAEVIFPAALPGASRVSASGASAPTALGDTSALDADETAPRDLSTILGRPPEVVPSEAEARGLLSAYLKTNRSRKSGSMTTAARLFAQSDSCSPALREAILREQGEARASKHQLPRPVKRAMQASPALVTYSRNPRDADVMFGHARGTLRRHWSADRRLYAGEAQSPDDGSINFGLVVPWPWGGCKCSDKFGVKVGRFQFLPTADHACDFIPGWTFAIRASGAYRAEDVCGAMGRLWRDTVVPDLSVMERGTWESHRVQELCRRAGVDVYRAHKPRQKLIEGVFNRLWTVLSVVPGQVGRYRGEMERENKLLAAAQEGRQDPREIFPMLDVAMAALEEAVLFHNRTPIESRQYGKWIPEQRWREDLAAHPRHSLDPALAYLWAPEVRTWTVRRACVGGMVEQPLGVTLPAHWWAPELLDCEGRKVTAHFDPWEKQSPATLTLAEDWPVRGWKAGRELARSVPCLEDLPTIARDAADSLAVHCGAGDISGAVERAKQMRSTLRSIVLREYRVLAADGSRARRETEIRAPEAAAPQPEGNSTPRQNSATPAAVNRSSCILSDTEEAAELARLEAAEARLAQQRGLIPISP